MHECARTQCNVCIDVLHSLVYLMILFLLELMLHVSCISRTVLYTCT